jgi:hypothetical protein
VEVEGVKGVKGVEGVQVVGGLGIVDGVHVGGGATEPLAATALAKSGLGDTAPGSPMNVGSKCMLTESVVLLAMAKRMAHKINEMNPTSAQIHDGQFQGVTPCDRLKVSDSR